jgi:3-dehydroquinate synthase
VISAKYFKIKQFGILKVLWQDSKKIAYFAGNFTQPMQSINANGYPIHFGKVVTNALNQLIAHQKYSSVFIVTDSHSNDCCLPKFLPQLAVDIPIEIIEFESGECQKHQYL